MSNNHFTFDGDMGARVVDRLRSGDDLMSVANDEEVIPQAILAIWNKLKDDHEPPIPESHFACSNCGERQVSTRYEEDFVGALNERADSRDKILISEQTMAPPGWARDEASEEFDGPKLCGRCAAGLHLRAWEIADRAN